MTDTATIIAALATLGHIATGTGRILRVTGGTPYGYTVAIAPEAVLVSYMGEHACIRRNGVEFTGRAVTATLGEIIDVINWEVADLLGGFAVVRDCLRTQDAASRR